MNAILRLTDVEVLWLRVAALFIVSGYIFLTTWDSQKVEMSLLIHAIESGTPIIAVNSRDTVFMGAVLRFLLKLKDSPELVKLDMVPMSKLSYTFENTPKIPWHLLHRQLKQEGKTLIVVNPPMVDPCMLHVGNLPPPPKTMIKALLKKSQVTEDLAEGVANELSGLTLFDAENIIRISQAKYGELTVKSVRVLRREFSPLTTGLQKLDRDLLFYNAPDAIKDWLKVEGKLLKHSPHQILQPRGLLFHGQPGTGKTSAAKYIANALDMNLYYLDIAGVLGKYMGESEKELRNALSQVESLSPCVFLIDEVEKLFQVEDDSGSIQRVLSILLWWLQEHTAKVLTIMTTNYKDVIPPELYRPGRIDDAIEIHPLGEMLGRNFVYSLFKRMASLYTTEPQIVDKDAGDIITRLYGAAKQVTQAKLTEEVKRKVKIYQANLIKE
jgi:hypothetical protein